MKNYFKTHLPAFIVSIVICFMIYESHTIKINIKDTNNQNIRMAKEVDSFTVEMNNFKTELNYLLIKENNNIESLSLDKIYFINLDRSKERLAQMQKSLKDLKPLVEYVRFSAVDGKNLRLVNKKTKENVNLYEKKQRNDPLIGDFTVICSDNEPSTSFDISVDFKSIPPRVVGSYGSACSHRLILNDIIKKGYKNALILEDDIFFDSLVKLKLSLALQQDIDYDILALGNLGSNNFYKQGLANELIGKVNAMPYVDSYIVTKNGAAKLLQENNFGNLPIDWFISTLITNNKIVAYAFRDPVTWQNKELEGTIGNNLGSGAW